MTNKRNFFLRFCLILFLFTIGSFYINAQGNNDAQLALQYYQMGDYEKAATVYEKLYNKTSNQAFYMGYFNSLMMLQDYNEAEKLVKKAIKKEGENSMLLADLGYVYEQSGNQSGARQHYDEAIKKLPADQNAIAQLANKFVSRQQNNNAIETYLKGRKATGNSYSFELANLYSATGNYGAMVEEYLDLLQSNQGYMQTVQVSLQTKLPHDPEGINKEALRVSLLRRIQKFPDNPIYSELLVWYMIQQKDFDAALLQAKALDRRYQEDGQRLLNLGSLAKSNGDYETAVKSYQYVVDKGKSAPYYINARMELLNAMNSRIEKEGYASSQQLAELKYNYEKALTELGKSAVTAPLVRGLAHLEAFHLNNTAEAERLLHEAIAIPGVRPNLLAELKLELGDVYLLQGEIWESALLYGQVEKAFKMDPLGQEAKLRNAKLSYYRGDFEWARAQLDILKSATSQLIANDALALSLLIADNTGLDTSTTAMLMYATADLLEYQNKDSLALATLDSILTIFRFHSLTDEVYFKKAEIMKKQGKFEEAIGYYNRIIKEYPFDILADDAMYLMGDLYENKLKDPQKAMEIYGDLLMHYPGSTFGVEARKRFRTLRGDNIVN
jgi:tetratricopeptide (TPR) repeat protein